VVPILGGNERRVTSFGYRPRWSPDGKHILFYGSFLRINTSEIPKVYVAARAAKPPREVLSGFLSEFSSFAWPGVLTVKGSRCGKSFANRMGVLDCVTGGESPIKSEFARQGKRRSSKKRK